MKLLQCVLALAASASLCTATTIMVVPVYEPLSLHGSDGDDAVSDVGEALQATIMARPMALTGAFPEVVIDAIGSPHKIPTNNENYTVEEANLLVLCGVKISGESTAEGLLVRLDVAEMSIPEDVDLTSRQVLKLALIAVRRTLEPYQAQQVQPLQVTVRIEGATENNKSLEDIGTRFVLGVAGDVN